VGQGWLLWEDAEAVANALAAPGVTALVARGSTRVIGAIQVLTDGGINWMVSMLVVALEHRAQGIGSALIRESFDRLNAKRLDLLTDETGASFYRRLPGIEIVGFRLAPPAE
jgi:ribosomal protein S18 acetylase RimI-like enzyme